MYALLAELVRDEGTTGLVVSHDSRSTAIADRVVHLRDGRISDEQRGEGHAVVVGEGGWLRVPEEALRAAGIVDRASVNLLEGAVELRPLPMSTRTVEPRVTALVRGSAGAAADVRGIGGVEAHERSNEAVAAVGLAEHASRRVDALSAGQRERVAVARALAAGPGVIVADEPTARLDMAATLALGGLFADLARGHGTTFVCATHDPVLIGLADAEVRLGS